MDPSAADPGEELGGPLPFCLDHTEAQRAEKKIFETPPPPPPPLSEGQAPVVQKVDSAIQRINIYPLDSAIGFPDTYPLDRDLSGG